LMNLQSLIVFQNSNWVLLDKPSGVLSVPARGGESDPRPVLGRLLEAELQQQVFPVHRLDYEVSGLILYALNSAAHKLANRWFDQHIVQKTYEALTQGSSPKVNSGEWRSLLLRGKKRAYESPAGKQAITQYEFKDAKGDINRWHLQPITGRSHQLRYELFRHENSILGDVLYGSRVEYGPKESIALRAIKIDFSQVPAIERLGLESQYSTSGLIVPI
jgi:tRNA pseudouridine32 synthase / 23S rRNA pseudouridine746 synthase